MPRPDGCVITTARLLIRPWRLEEADRLFDIHRRLEVARWLSGIPMKDRREAVERLERYNAELAGDPRFGVWAVVERTRDLPAGTHVGNHRSGAVCRKIGMRLLGITNRWYPGPSLMFWTGSRVGQEPSLDPDEQAPTVLQDT